MAQGHVFKVNKVYMYVHTRKWRMFANLHLCTWITLHIFEQRIGFEQQISIKAKLVEYTCSK